MITRFPLLSALSAVLLGWACGPAAKPQDAPAAYHQTADDHGLRGPLLWEVQGAGKPSYLLGTLHIGYDADRDLPQWIWDKLEQSDTFVMEVDLASLSPTEMARASQLPDGHSLEQLLGPDDWQLLRQSVPLAASGLDRLQPWAAISLLLSNLYPTPVSLDQALARRARMAGKAMVYLEDWRLQTEILAMTTAEELGQLLEPSSEARKRIERLIDAYRRGDFEAVGAIALDPAAIAANPAQHRRMFADRNRAWVDKLHTPLLQGGLFVAVGAGHYAGEDGLIELLRSRGHVVKRRIEP